MTLCPLCETPARTYTCQRCGGEACLCCSERGNTKGMTDEECANGESVCHRCLRVRPFECVDSPRVLVTEERP